MTQPSSSDTPALPAAAAALPTPRRVAGAASPSQASIVILASCAAFSVANVYYAQPLLDAVSHELGIAQAAAGSLITATQVGSIAALLLVLPLGDLVGRKRLMAGELGLLILVLLGVSWTSNAWVLLLSMMALGMLGTAATQGAIAYAATLAAPSDRGRVVGLVQSGVLVGVLGSRSLAGLVADLAGWRAVFLVSAALAAASLLLILWRLPKAPVTAAALPYGRLILSMFALLRQERVLRVRGCLGFLVFAAFGAFWSAIVLPLRVAPHHWSHTAVGALGLIGMAGALAAARAGRWADAGHGERTTAFGLALLAGSWLCLVQLPHSMVALVVGIVLLDLSGQAVHVTSQSMIFKGRPELHSRLVGCYMLFYALGLGSGAFSATALYAAQGWSGVCGFGFAVSTLALAFWFGTRHPAALGAPAGPTPNDHQDPPRP